MFGKIFVPLENIETSEILLKHVFRLAHRLNAHVDVSRIAAIGHSKNSKPSLIKWPAVGSMTQFPLMDIDQKTTAETQAYMRHYQDDVERKKQAYRDIFTKACHEYKINKDSPTIDSPSARWLAQPDHKDGDEFITHQALVSDICMAARPRDEDHAWLSSIIHHILFNAIKPLLLFPIQENISDMQKVPQHVAIAWNGHRETSHAVSHAMPFLSQAEKVTLFTYSSHRTNASCADDLQYWLKTHNIASDKVILKKPNIFSVGASLIEEIKERNISLIISGAYGHSRMREFILGGVTTHLLACCPIPLLMAH